jgi:polyphosphate kinase
MELQARFDEEANIHWSKILEEEDAHLLDGVPGLKVHAKLCLITRQEGKKLVRYASIGTGNFNETTAKIYSDHALLTSNKEITSEVYKVFEFLENNYKTHVYKHLVVSPFTMRKKLTKLIKKETKNALAGKDAWMYIKLNSLVDRSMIDYLYKASQAGVKIKMVIRGICSLVPGIEGISDNIEVISIVDKYLEHSRIFIFCNDGNEKYYISSADWMIRNLDNRVEVAVPVYDPDIRKELKTFFELQFKDVKKARIINCDQLNKFRPERDGLNYRAQDDIYNMLKNGSVLDKTENKVDIIEQPKQVAALN